jgi:hypothetical protein
MLMNLGHGLWAKLNLGFAGSVGCDRIEELKEKVRDCLFTRYS